MLPGNKETIKIDQTPNVVTEIKKISEFTAACYYEDLVLKETKTNKKVDNKAGKAVAKIFKKDALITDELVVVVNGSVRAGFNLQKMEDTDVVVKDDTLVVALPKVEILDVIVNPSDYEIYMEDGNWTQQQVNNVVIRAKEKIKKDAVDAGLLKKANDAGIKKFTELFKSFGYKEVKINIKK